MGKLTSTTELLVLVISGVELATIYLSHVLNLMFSPFTRQRN